MNVMAFAVFTLFVVAVLAMSFYFARKTQSASGYFAAGGQIHWSVNGIAFAGDYLSAASFLGICGMIAMAGYDGFLYSIGYLAGWIVALFVVAEPMKRLGKYTFTDALDSTFNSKGIQLAAGISTLVVSIFYLIPQMVGAGDLVTPLLGLPHSVGVIMVGAIVITIVATAGMRSTTYVQFLKGALLVVFSTILVIVVLARGLTTTPDQGGKVGFYQYRTIAAAEQPDGKLLPEDAGLRFLGKQELKEGEYIKLSTLRPVAKNPGGVWAFPLVEENVDLVGFQDALNRFLSSDGVDAIDLNGIPFVKQGGKLFMNTITWWKKTKRADGAVQLQELASLAQKADGTTVLNGMPPRNSQQLQVGNLEKIRGKTGKEAATGPIGPFDMLAAIGDKDTVVRRWKKEASFTDGGYEVSVFGPVLTAGNKIMRPGLKFKVEGTMLERLDFVSLMLALFCGTAALPHILIRYYTVPSPAAARKSTIVAIAAIGFFYILTLFMGLGAMVNGVINPISDNMSAPLLARSFNVFLFAIISAIAFATVLGTVSGLIVAASGAVAHDLLDRFYHLELNERQKVVIGKAAAFTVGLVAIILGIVFKGMNVSYLVGWAFAVAASANLPAILMLLFWKRTTSQGIVASIVVGVISAVGIILLSPDMYERYGMERGSAPFAMNQPALISIPLSFIALVAVSLVTRKKAG